MLLCGTYEGVYRLDEGPVGDADRALDCGRVWEVAAGPGGAFAATADGLYRSPEDGRWTEIDLEREPTAVLPVEEPVVGTSPVGVLRRSGDEWHPVGDIGVHPDSERWRDRAPGGESAVRTLAVHPEHGLLAGLEPGGVLAFEDIWRQHGRGVHDDVHHLTVLEEGGIVAATGNGLYRTADGEAWIRLDTDFRDFHATYFRESIVHGDRLYAGAYDDGPDGPRGAILHGPLEGRSLERTPVPLAEPAFPISWTVHDGTLVAGTMRVGESFRQREPASLLALRDGEWTVGAELPAGITSLATVR